MAAQRVKSREHLSPVRPVTETRQRIATVATASVASRPPLESHEGAIGGNLLRAGVLGVNDGLVSNLSLVMGVAGAALESRVILITGLAGLLAGACSMALGEWLSVQSSRELHTWQLKVEKQHLALIPEVEQEEFVAMYKAKGLSPALAHQVAAQLMENPDKALDTMAREELGINPDDLGGSAWQAASASFVLFTLGAIVPVAPFIFLAGMSAVISSLVASAVALLIVGAAISRLTGRGALFSAVRQLLFGMAAAGLTFGIGKLIGANIGG
jgi:VIT1/CCC1 family predicted Fe2+/Mn2+ transporter